MTLGLCMIVKNEEATLARCLESVRGIFDQIVIADTGSKDKTRAIARRYTDKLLFFRWRDDFAAARNFAFSQMTTDYIMWLDADDVVEKKDYAALLELKKRLGGADIYMLPYCAEADEYGNIPLLYYRERIVRRGFGSWEGAVHEAIPLAGRIEYADAAVTHKKPHGREHTCRNLLLYARLFARGTMPNERQKFYFARELQDNGLYDTAATVYEAFLHGNGWAEDKICACRGLAACLKAAGRRKKRLEALFSSFAYAPPRSEVCCDIGDFFREENKFGEAIFWYKLALNVRRDAHTGGFMLPDYGGFIPCLQLAVCYDRLHNYPRAEYYNELAGKIHPHDKSYLYNKRYFESLKNKG